MIELTDVTKVYPMGTTEVRALDGVSLRIDEGEFVAIMGPSGSGKSTMMHLLGCLDRPTGGDYHLLDQAVGRLSDRQLARFRNRSIGFVFQTFNLVSRMSAWENVAMPLFYARRTRTKAAAMGALERVNLTDRADHQPNELSGGERQRVAIARSIVNRPPLILADEPTGNLDTRTGEQIMQIFHELHRAGTTVIVVTHEREIAEQTDRIISMRDGKIIDDQRNGRERAPETKTSAPGPPAGVEDDEAQPVETSDIPTAVSAPEVVAAPDVAAEPPTEPSDPATAPITHPKAKQALVWAIAGPACWLGMAVWGMISTLIQKASPGFAMIAGAFVSLTLMAMMLISPIVAFVQARRASRWIRIAPERFRGMGLVRAAQWVSGVYLLLFACAVVAMVFVVRAMLQSGAFKPPH